MPETIRRHTGRLIMGITVIALGVLFTLDNLGVADAHEILRWWPVALIAYGVTRLIGLGRRPSVLAGLLFTLVGTWLLLHSLGYVQQSFWQLWPIFLIFWGIAIMRGGGRWYRRGRRGWAGVAYSRRRGWRTSGEWDDREDPSVIIGASGYGKWRERTAAERGGGGESSSGAASAADPGATGAGGDEASWNRFEDHGATFSSSAFMGSVSRKVVSQEFRGGEVIALMGGGDIDLRSARMADGTARIEVNLVMGGVNLFVPEDWSIEFRGLPIMGSVEDRSKRPAGAPGGRLIISGVVLMSSVIIRN